MVDGPLCKERKEKEKRMKRTNEANERRRNSFCNALYDDLHVANIGQREETMPMENGTEA